MKFSRGMFAAVALSIALFLVYSIECGKLSSSRVLLPVDTGTPSSYELHVNEGGCYKWTSSRPDIIQVRSDGAVCSTKAWVVGVAKEPAQVTVTIEAKDPVTGQTLLCQGLVVAIAQIRLVTVARELFLDDNPVAFEITALDQKGNQLSSINSLLFDWSVEADHSVDSGRVLRFLTYAESPYDAPDKSVQDFEQRGLRGHVVLVEALHVGVANLRAKLSHAIFRDVEPVSVKITVVANLVLRPSLLYLMPHTTVELKLYQIKRGEYNVLPLPSTQYNFRIENADVGSLDTERGIVTALKSGATDINLRYKNMKHPETMHPTTATLHVVQPSHISIVILPHRNFALISGDEYEVVAEIYSENDQLIFPGEGVDVTVTMPSRHLKLLSATVNGTHRAVLAGALGSSEISAELRSVIDTRDGRVHPLPVPVVATAKFEVFARVEIRPKEVVLPYDPAADKVYEVAFSAIGGDGKYIWMTRNASRVAVTDSGVVKVPSATTDCVVEVAMSRNHKNSDTANVKLVSPAALEIVDGVREAVVGSKLSLGIVLFPPAASTSVMPFTLCQFFPFEVVSSDEERFECGGAKPPKEDMDGACAAVDVKGTTVGFPTVTVSGRVSGAVPLKASALVGFYEKLRVVDSVGADPGTVLAIGSWHTLKFVGGPRPWIDSPGSHFTRASVADESLLRVKNVRPVVTQRSDGGVYGLDVACLDFGESTITVVVGNEPSKTLPDPVRETLTVKVICEVPADVELAVDQPMDALKTGACPLTSANSKSPIVTVAAACAEDTKFVARVVDSKGRRFSSFSSLGVHWILTSEAKGNRLAVETGSQSDDVGETAILTNTLHPSGHPSVATVKIIVEGYRAQRGDNSLLGVHWKKYDDLSASLNLNLVDRASLSPSKIAVFNHPSNVARVGIRGGSGVYNVTTSVSNVVTVGVNSPRRVVELTPVGDGTAEIRLMDLCLPSESVAVVSVAGVGRVDLRAVSKVELGRAIQGTVVVFDKRGFQIEGSSLSFLKVKPIVTGNFLGVEVLERDPASSDFGLKIDGLAVGLAKLEVEVGKVKSNPISINVFPAMRLLPRNITLVPGAVMQVEATGGPQPSGTLHFSIVDVLHGDKNDRSGKPVAEVSDSGVVRAVRLGLAMLRAEAHGMEAVTTEATSANGDALTVYSSDIVYVHVVNLTGVMLHVPVKTLERGTEMPAVVFGYTQQRQLAPTAFGSANPSLQIEWSVTPSASVLLFDSPLAAANINDGVGAPNRFAVRLRANAAGEVVVRVRVKSQVDLHDKAGHQIFQSVVLEDIARVTVIDGLLMLPPSSPGVNIFVTPNTRLRLRSNRASAEDVKFLMAEKNSAGTVSADGLLTTGAQAGHLSVLLHHTAHDQMVPAVVHVKPYRYLVVGARRTVRVDSTGDVYSIPVGSRIELGVGHRDELGREYHATSASVAFRVSRSDVARVEAKSSASSKSLGDLLSSSASAASRAAGSAAASAVSVLTVECLQPGESVLKVWDTEDPKMTDYVHLVCDSFAYPHDISVSIGDAVCFNSPMLFNGAPGLWTSSSDKILTISKRRGVAVAQEPGKVSVFYKGVDGEAGTQVSVDVLPAVGIELVPESDLRGVSLGDDAVVSILIRVVTADHERAEPSATRLKFCTDDELREMETAALPVVCHGRFDRSPTASSLKFDALFALVARVDSVTGSPRCLLRRRTELGGNAGWDTEELAALNAQVVVHATLDGRGDLSSNEVRLPLYPAFTVNLEGRRVLSVTSSLSSAVLNVTATEEVFNSILFQPSNEVFVEVLKSKKDIVGPFWTVPIHVTPAFWKTYGIEKSPLTLTVSSPLTGQRVLVQIEVETRGVDAESIRQCAVRDSGTWFEASLQTLLSAADAWVVLQSLAVVVILLVSYNILVQKQPWRWGYGRGVGFASSLPASGPPSSSASPSPSRRTPSGSTVYGGGAFGTPGWSGGTPGGAGYSPFPPSSIPSVHPTRRLYPNVDRSDY